MNFQQLSRRLSWGKANRLAQIFKPDANGKYHIVMLAVDHPYFYGPTTGLVDPRRTVTPLVKYADAISPARGTLEHCLDPKVATPVILRVSGGNSMTKREELSNESIITSIEQALELNAIGVSVSVYIGSRHQEQTMQNLGKVIDEARKYNLLVLGITAVGAELEEKLKGKKTEKLQSGKVTRKRFSAAGYFAHAGRLIYEFGADIVKTYYCKDFRRIRRGIHVPIVIAGGKKIPELEALRYTFDSMQAGADGVDMGRNIFQAENPVAMIQAVRKIVHEGKTAEQAYQFYKRLKNKK